MEFDNEELRYIHASLTKEKNYIQEKINEQREDLLWYKTHNINSKEFYIEACAETISEYEADLIAILKIIDKIKNR
jgi:hypothetical protein